MAARWFDAFGHVVKGLGICETHLKTGAWMKVGVKWDGQEDATHADSSTAMKPPVIKSIATTIILNQCV
jgi:hypothetical protein